MASFYILGKAFQRLVPPGSLPGAEFAAGPFHGPGPAFTKCLRFRRVMIPSSEVRRTAAGQGHRVIVQVARGHNHTVASENGVGSGRAAHPAPRGVQMGLKEDDSHHTSLRLSLIVEPRA